MNEVRQFYFGPFTLDVANECLIQRGKEIRLQPKVFALLRFLAEHPGRVVTKDTLLENLWPNVYVSDSVLSVYIRKIRKALGDDPNHPHFVETAHRRGYRFISPVTSGPRPGSRDTPIDGKVSASPVIGEPATNIGSQPLVGREKELSFLEEKLETTLQGMGSVVFVTGPAGIGKTRLVREVRDYARRKGCQWMSGKCDGEASDAYRPWSEMIRGYLWQKDPKSLSSLMGSYASQLASIIPELAEGKETPSAEAPGDARRKRDRLFEAWIHLFAQIANEMPLVLFLDDLQWAISMDLLHHLARNIGNQRVLVLGAYREDELKDNPRLSQAVLNMNRERLLHFLPLATLGELDVHKLIATRFKEAIAPGLAQLIYHKTAGNPFFVEEVLRLLQERQAIVLTERGWDARRSGSIETPESVKAVVNERLQRLGKQAERLLRIASVVGREFSLVLLRELVSQEQEGLIEVIDRCEEARLVLFQRRSAEEEYIFAHDLIQEALYESIGPARRRRYHLQVGQAIEKVYAPSLEEWYEALTHHFLIGSDLTKAAAYSHRAGVKAARSVDSEAITYFERALAALERVPESRESIEQSVSILLDLGAALIAIKGRRAPELKQTYTRAQNLCHKLGDTPQLFPVLWGLSRIFNQRGELQAARELGEQLVTLAKRKEDTGLLLEAHHTLWSLTFNLGDFVSAKVHTEQGTRLYNPKQHGQLASRYAGHDPGRCGLHYAAKTLWLLGYPDQALRKVQEVLALGRELANPHELGFALFAAAFVYQLRGEDRSVQQWAEALMALGTENKIPRWAAYATALRGWLLCEQGRWEEGTGLISQGRVSGAAQLYETYFVALLAEAYEKSGQPEQGLNVAAEALEKVRQMGICYYEAELHRIKGELLSKSGVQEAEECFCRAIEISRRQSAKSLELRAVMSLSRLWHQQGKTEDARQMLGEIYSWFTEGFDTADLKEAKALIEELT